MITESRKIFIFIVIAAVFVVVSIFIAKLLRPNRPTVEKLKHYECGEDPVGTPWVKFNIRFYVVALIFLIFDVEVVLLFPWAVNYQAYGWYGFSVGIIFLLVLILGMAYEWRKGDLEWEKPHPSPLELSKVLASKTISDSQTNEEITEEKET